MKEYLTLLSPSAVDPMQSVVLSHTFVYAFQIKSLHTSRAVGETCFLNVLTWDVDSNGASLPFLLIAPMPMYFFQMPGFEFRFLCIPDSVLSFTVANQGTEPIVPSITLVGNNVDEIYQTQPTSKSKTFDIK